MSADGLLRQSACQKSARLIAYCHFSLYYYTHHKLLWNYTSSCAVATFWPSAQNKYTSVVRNTVSRCTVGRWQTRIILLPIWFYLNAQVQEMKARSIHTIQQQNVPNTGFPMLLCDTASPPTPSPAFHTTPQLSQREGGGQIWKNLFVGLCAANCSCWSCSPATFLQLLALVSWWQHRVRNICGSSYCIYDWEYHFKSAGLSADFSANSTVRNMTCCQACMKSVFKVCVRTKDNGLSKKGVPSCFISRCLLHEGKMFAPPAYAFELVYIVQAHFRPFVYAEFATEGIKRSR